MAKYHPELDLLTEYAAGNLPLAQSACLSAHLNYCEACQKTVEQLQNVGASLSVVGSGVAKHDYRRAPVDGVAELGFQIIECATVVGRHVADLVEDAGYCLFDAMGIENVLDFDEMR